MRRRQFIRKALSGLPLTFALPSLLTACNNDDDNTTPDSKSVIIVGAGVAGMAAAQKLQQSGFVVTVLEAQEKAGGRLRTNRSLGIAFDEGASWIHGPNGNPISDLASEAGAFTFLTDNESLVVYDFDGTPYNEVFADEQYAQFETTLEAVRSSGLGTQSFAEVFNTLYPNAANSRMWKYMLSAYLEFDAGGDIADLSALYFDDDETFSGEDVIITNGYDKIMILLAQGLDIRLNKRVTAVDYGTEKVSVMTADEVFKADYALITVPLGVLKNNAIAFTPPLPNAQLGAIERLNMGNVNKFLLVWDTAFWDENIQYIGFTPETKGKFNYFVNVKKIMLSVNALMTFAFGHYATTTESMSDAQVTNEIMQHLRAIYGNTIPAPTAIQRTRWGQNNNSFGAYSFVGKGSSGNDYDVMAESIANKVFFAGEHTERDYRGTVHGAYLSGIREADKIINL